MSRREMGYSLPVLLITIQEGEARGRTLNDLVCSGRASIPRGSTEISSCGYVSIPAVGRVVCPRSCPTALPTPLAMKLASRDCVHSSLPYPQQCEPVDEEIGVVFVGLAQT